MKVKTPTQEEIRQTENWGIWEKEVSEFSWSYSEKETCYILEGNAMVIDNSGNQISFKKGDWVEFEVGLECTWKIENAIKKRYMFGE